MKALYDLGIQLYYLLIKLLSLRNEKARKWASGREGLFIRLSDAVEPGSKICWFHASSYGESEQGRSVIEMVKKMHPEYKILLTFFSPSGYEMMKDYEYADYVFYIPLDTRANARRFIDIARPEKAFFIKYEFWYHFLIELRDRKIPTYIFSAIFHPSQIYFRPWGRWYLKALNAFTHFFVQNKSSYSVLKDYGFNNVTIGGDTRIDRVGQIADSTPVLEKLEAFCIGKKIIVAGSIWKDDESIIIEYINNSESDTKWVAAPHEISGKVLQRISRSLNKPYAFYSKASNEDLISAKVLIVDGIGYLSPIYRYAKLAYIGGGFEDGIHNILEPAAFGVPVVFGPKYKKFQEAHDLIALKAAFSIDSFASFKLIADKILADEDMLKNASEKASNYISENRGASRLVVDKVFTS